MAKLNPLLSLPNHQNFWEKLEISTYFRNARDLLFGREVDNSDKHAELATEDYNNGGELLSTTIKRARDGDKVIVNLQDRLHKFFAQERLSYEPGMAKFA